MSENKAKRNIFISLFVLVLLVLAVGSYNRNRNGGKVTVVLDYGNNKEQVLQAPVPEQKRAWNLLQQAAAVAKVDLRANNDFVPVKIDGFLNGYQGKKWTFYVNGKEQTSSPFDVFVKSPDKITFRFE